MLTTRAGAGSPASFIAGRLGRLLYSRAKVASFAMPAYTPTMSSICSSVRYTRLLPKLFFILAYMRVASMSCTLPLRSGFLALSSTQTYVAMPVL